MIMYGPTADPDQRRFFLVDVCGDCRCWVVASSIDAAKGILRSHGVPLTTEQGSDPDADGVEWRELPLADVPDILVDTDDDRGIVPLSNAMIGDWFLSEW